MPIDADASPAARTSAPLLAAALVLLLGLGLSIFAVDSTQQRLDSAARYHYSLQFDRLEASISEQLQRPLTGMQALIGLYQANQAFAAPSFHAWVASQDMSQQYQGVLGFGFAERSGGWHVKYFEPALTAAPPLHIDPAGDTLERVVNSGEAALWPLQQKDGSAGPGSEYLYLTPIYRKLAEHPSTAQRQQALVGLVFARIELNQLLLPSLALAERWTEFDLIDRTHGIEPTLVYSSAAAVPAAGSRHGSELAQRQFSNHRALVMGGRVLELQAGSTAGFDAQRDRDTPILVGLAGALLSLLLAVIFWQLMAARVRAQKLALRMTSDLNRLAHVVQRTTHLVFMGDVKHKLVWVNQAFTRFTGVELTTALGAEMGRVFDLQRSQSAGLDALREALLQQRGLRVQIPITSNQGLQRWFDIDLQPEYDAQGHYAGFIVIAADVTSQQQAGERVAQALRENEALLNAINQHSIVSIADPGGRIIYVNEMFTRISGYSAEELMGANHRIVKSDQQPDSYWDAMWKTIAAGYTWRDTVCNRAKDGSLYWVDTVITPLVDANGQIEKYISIRTDVSPARRAKEQIATERQQLQAILEGTNAGTWEWDPASGEYRINARWAGMLGYSPGELGPIDADQWTRLCHPDDQALASLGLDKHLRGEADFIEREFRMRHRDGHWVWVQSRGKVSSWVSPGQPRGVSGIHLDISHQKKLQAELHQNNQVMQSIMANIPVALSVFDGDLRLIARNDKFAELLDFPAELFEGPDVGFERFIRFNAARGEYGGGDIEKQILTIIDAARHPVHHQFERSRPNGLSLEIRGAPMPGGGLVTTYADITARKQAEAELQRSTRMLQSVLDSASEVAVVTLDLQHHITLFNKGAERLLGYSAEQAINQLHPEVFFDPAEVEARSSALSAQLNRQVLGLQSVLDESVLGKRGEWTYIHRDGHRFAAALVVTALTDANGERTGYLCVSHDITQEKEHETRLQIAMEEAEQASTAKGQFLANMSHEIRTPMNAILGMLRLLQKTPLDTRQQDYAGKTESAARSLLGLLNDLLDFSKAEAGKMQVDAQPFRLDTILRDLSVILSATVGIKPVEVLFDIDPRIPAGLIGDAMRLQQILINLTGNAIKFTDQGEVLLSVQMRARSQDSVSLHFAVRDSGIGIDPKHQRHIFSGFSQAEASTTRRFGGTGLGLSICRHLIALMGGDLGLESSPGLGSTFFFTLALPIASSVQANAQATQAQALQVLLVEDNAPARACIAEMARTMGWNVETCDSAEAALTCMQTRIQQRQAAFDALLIDWSLPDTDSADLAHRLQTRQGAPLPTIALGTAQSREALAEGQRRYAAHLDGFLIKPMTASMLDEAVHHARSHPNDAPPLGTPKRKTAQRLAGLRLLVVEDNQINQQVAKELLGGEGAQIDIAENGQLGVDAVARAQPPYDAVLMDIQMPVMDGYTASVTIRHELGLRHLPIIAMTANAMTSDREACLAAGMNDHIGKPFDLPQLVDLLCRHTGHQARAEASEAAPGPAATSTPAPAPATTTTPLPAHAASGGLQCEQALAMLGDNLDLFIQICEAYLVEISSLPAKMAGFFNDRQLEEAVRALHTAKGLSRTVGASDLAALCSEYEKQVTGLISAGRAADAAQISALLSGLGTEVASTHRALTELVAQWQEQTPPPEPPVEEAPAPGAHQLLIAELHILRDLLAQSDLQALDVHAALRERHRYALPKMQALQDSLLAFDFSKAVVQCNELIREFDIQK